jgi:hypothetical protein
MIKKGFNLLKPQLEPPTVWTKIYDWVLGTARVIIIVVQIIVVIAFAIRMVVDVQSKNLDREIVAKESVLSSLQESELRFKKIQKQTAAFEKALNISMIYSAIFAELNVLMPNNATELNIQFVSTSILISGKASVSAIGNLETELKTSRNFTNTELVQVESRGISQDETADFTIRTQIRDPRFRNIQSN